MNCLVLQFRLRLDYQIKAILNDTLHRENHLRTFLLPWSLKHKNLPKRPNAKTKPRATSNRSLQFAAKMRSLRKGDRNWCTPIFDSRESDQADNRCGT